MMKTVQEKEVYVLGLRECLGEWSICGVYTSKVKLLEDYQRMTEENESCRPFSDEPREPVIYRFQTNEFIGETSVWNDGKLYLAGDEYEISIQEVKERVEIYKCDAIQVFCNFNFEDRPKVQIIVDETDVDVFLDTDMIVGESSEDFNRYVLPMLKKWYDDNKEILKQIWKERRYIQIPNWFDG